MSALDPDNRLSSVPDAIDDRLTVRSSNRLPSLNYLLECSVASLYDLELAALVRSANCLKQARLEWEEAVAQREAAGVTRWLIENREALLEVARKTLDAQASHQLPGDAI